MSRRPPSAPPESLALSSPHILSSSPYGSLDVLGRWTGLALREEVMLPTVILFSEAAQIEVGWRFCSPWGSGRRGVWLAP